MYDGVEAVHNASVLLDCQGLCAGESSSPSDGGLREGAFGLSATGGAIGDSGFCVWRCGEWLASASLSVDDACVYAVATTVRLEVSLGGCWTFHCVFVPRLGAVGMLCHWWPGSYGLSLPEDFPYAKGLESFLYEYNRRLGEDYRYTC